MNAVIQTIPVRPGEEELSQMEARALALHPTDDQTEQQALLFVTECKAAQKRLDVERDELVRPHLDEQRRINGIYKPVMDAFDRLWRGVDARLSDYRKQRQAAIEEANRKAIAAADELRRQAEEKERKAREAAEVARAQGDEKAAIKLEAKADIAAQQAVMTAPVILSASPKTQELATGVKATGKRVDIWMFTNGMDIDGDYYGDDPRVQDLPMSFFKLDTKKLGKAVMAGADIPGTKRDFKYVTAARGK